MADLRVQLAKRMRSRTSIPFNMRKWMVGPVVEALSNVLVEQGELNVRSLGRFYMQSRKHPRNEDQFVVTIKFKPTRSLKKRMREAWEKKVTVTILPPEDAQPTSSQDAKQSNLLSSQESVSSADGMGSVGSSAPDAVAEEGTSTIRT